MFLSFLCVIIRHVSWQVYGILGLVSASQTQIPLCHNLLLGCQIIWDFVQSTTVSLQYLGNFSQWLSAHVPWLRAHAGSNPGTNVLMPIIRAKGFSSFPSCNIFGMQLGPVSLTFCELPKIFSGKYTTPEITFMVKICMCAQRKLWAHVQSFSLKFSSQVLFVQYTNFEIIFWRAGETLVKQPPDAFPVLVRKEGAAVDCAHLQCFLVDNSCNVCIRVADRLFE